MKNLKKAYFYHGFCFDEKGQSPTKLYQTIAQKQIIVQTSVVQRVDNAIHRINHYPVNGIVFFLPTLIHRTSDCIVMCENFVKLNGLQSVSFAQFIKQYQARV